MCFAGTILTYATDETAMSSTPTSSCSALLSIHQYQQTNKQTHKAKMVALLLAANVFGQINENKIVKLNQVEVGPSSQARKYATL